MSGYPGYLLRRASGVAMGRLGAELARLSLRPTEATVLLVIDANQKATQSEIGKLLDIARANMAPLVEAMQLQMASVGHYVQFGGPESLPSGGFGVALMDADGQDPAAGCDAGNRVAVSAQKGADARGFGVAFDGDRVVLVGGASERGYQRDETAIAVLAPGVLFRNGFD